MSLYNALFGTNSNADILLASLGITRANVPRFRDCYLEDGKIVIYTRTGGGNRHYYESVKSCRDEYPEYFKEGSESPSGPWNEDLRDLPGYLTDSDDEYDVTYATFLFEPSAGVVELMKGWGQLDGAIAPADKWTQLFSDLQNNTDSPESTKALEVGKQIFGQIEKSD